jgi:hypothetical protein
VCLAPWLGWLWHRLQRRLPPPSGARLFVHRTGNGRVVRRSTTSVASLVPSAALFRRRPKGHTRRRTPWRWRPRSWMVLSSLRRRAGARTSLCTVRRPPSPVSHRCGGGCCLLLSVLRWLPQLLRLPAAEVVASTGETTSATCRRASNSLALMASLSPPVGGRVRGPLRNGTHIKAAITVVMPSWRIPQGQWPRAFQRTPLASGSLYLQSRDGTRIPLEGGCNTFAFCKVLLSTIYQAVLALIYVPLVPVVCGVTDSSLVPGPPGM